MTPEEDFTETLSKIDKEIQTTTAYGRYDWLKDVRDRLCIVLAELGECSGPPNLDRCVSEYHTLQERGHENEQPTELHTTIQDPDRT